jgi:hypothetical protein
MKRVLSALPASHTEFEFSLQSDRYSISGGASGAMIPLLSTIVAAYDAMIIRVSILHRFFNFESCAPPILLLDSLFGGHL